MKSISFHSKGKKITKLRTEILLSRVREYYKGGEGGMLWSTPAQLPYPAHRSALSFL